jgi:glycerol-3-phosphate dehydrogenase
VVVLSKGLVAPLGALPTAFASERVNARAVACLGGVGGSGPARACLRTGASLVVGSTDRTFAAQLVQVLAGAGLAARRTDDVLGVEVAGVAASTAALAARAAAPAGPHAAGAAAGRVWSELSAYAAHIGARPQTLSGLAGTGDLIATVMASGDAGATLGQSAEALDTLPLLVERLEEERVERHAVEELAALVAGNIAPQAWLEGLTAPAGRPHAAAA